MSLNEGIDAFMTGMATLTPMTAEPMSTQAVDLGSAVLAIMRQAQGNPQAEAYGNLNGAIHPQLNG